VAFSAGECFSKLRSLRFLLLEFLTEDSKGSEDCQCWLSVFSHPDHPCNPWFLDLTIQRFNSGEAIRVH
jgi:hypothetical protein